MTIGERIKSTRLAKGLTQKEVAIRCGIADSAIRKYETGKITPKVEMLERIASALEVPVTTLMGWDGPDGKITFEVPISELKESIHYMLGGDTQEQKKPTPVSEDGLTDEEKELIKLFQAAPASLRAAALAVLRSAEGQSEAPGGFSKA